MGRVTRPRPTWPIRRMYSCTSSAPRFRASDTPPPTSAGPRRGKPGIPEAFQPIAQCGGAFKLQIPGGGLHLLLERRQEGVELGLRLEPLALVLLLRHGDVI